MKDEVMQQFTTKRTLLLCIAALSIIAVCTASSISDTTDADPLKVSVSEVSYDPSTDIVSVSGTSTMASVNIQVSGEGYKSPIAHFEVLNGAYSGDIKVKALSPGSYAVMAWVSDGTSAQKSFIVDDRIPATSAVMSESAITLTGSESDTLSVSLLPENTTDSIASIKWSSSNNGAYVSVDGGTVSLNAVSKSTQTVTATITTDAGDTFACTCDVTTEYGTLAATPELVSIYIGDRATVKLTMPAGFSESSWVSGNPDVASATGSGQTGTITGTGKGQAVVTVIVGSLFKTTVAVSVSEKPVTVDSYTFLLRMDCDSELADYGESGLHAEDLRKGITLTASGTNAGAALESALKANKIPYSFWSGGDILYWVDNIFGLGDHKLNNNDWKYWIQYHDGSYNSWTLGHYTDGGHFELIYGITSEDGQVVKPEQHGGDTPAPSGGESTTVVENPDGSSTKTTISADGKTTTVVETDADGNKTTTKTEKQDDGSVKSTTTNPDGSSEVTSTSAPVTTVTDDGKKTETSSSTVSKDASGNVTGSTDSTVEVVEKKDGSTEVSTSETVKDASGKVTGSTAASETTDKNGNVTAKSETVKDASGRETYSKTEEYVPETTRSEGNALITESSSRVTERESGTTTVVSESSTAIVSADGWAETETVKEQSVTGADGKTVSTKVVETVTLDADGDTVTSVATEAVSADGKKTSERTVAAESANGTVRAGAEVSGDSAEIVTVVDVASAGGAFVLSKEQAEQAVSLQEKVSDAIADVQDQTKVIQVESAGSAGSLTVAQDVIGTVTESGSALRMSSSAGSLTVPSDVLSNISQEDEVTISVTPVRDQDMSGAQKDAVADAVAVDVKIMSGDRSLGSQLDGTITISVRYTPADGKVAVAYYIADDGTRERMGGTYDPARGEVTFGTTHCSIYAIFDEDAEPAGEGGDNTMLYIGAAIAAVVLIAVAAVLISRRSRTTFP